MSGIVSLLPSATEIVYALGLDDRLVGVTFECDEPARARQDNTVVVALTARCAGEKVLTRAKATVRLA